MSEQRLCEGGIEIGTGPCRVCGRTAREHCGKPLPDPRDARIAELEGWVKMAYFEGHVAGATSWPVDAVRDWQSSEARAAITNQPPAEVDDD